MSLLLARTWSDWIAFPLLVTILLVIVLLGVGYLLKVVRPRYPKQ